MDSSSARTIADLPERFNAACDLLDHNVAERADKVAVIDRDGRTTYGDLADRVAAMAAVFGALGVRREQR
ncbi:AMP-binding protein, partial [Sphingomonas sp.]|uniref:AMP-binding protein n=1 Tax=Sphingomonas sp. TaxID=28214 RepID=UPI002FC9F1D3